MKKSVEKKGAKVAKKSSLGLKIPEDRLEEVAGGVEMVWKKDENGHFLVGYNELMEKGLAKKKYDEDGNLYLEIFD